MIKAYYNEFDQNAAAWLRQLIKNGDITQGVVDERSIIEVEPADIKGFERVHWFAGIGTWDYVLNRAGWGNRPIWTASLPCQPFSAAGKQLGKSDERHLLSHYLELVRKCRPNTQIGEQVERAIKHGWLDDLQANMETAGYAVGHCVLGAHSVGAPHIRQRLYWVAKRRVADSHNNYGSWEIKGVNEKANGYEVANGAHVLVPRESCGTGGVVRRGGNTERKGLEGHGWHENSLGEQGRDNQEPLNAIAACLGDCVEWLYCRDNKYRPVKPGISPLVDGAARKLVRSSDSGETINANSTQEARSTRLEGYGNAIQVDTAAAFVSAYINVLTN